MIQAEVQGKLGRDGQMAHSRSEDLLTSTVFGLIRHLPAERVMLPLLERARRAAQTDYGLVVECRPEWMRLAAATSFELNFWPRSRLYGEPDLHVIIRGRNSEIVHEIVIEAKLYARKSNRAEQPGFPGDAEELEVKPASSDQLARYWEYLAACGSRVTKTVVYLTAHSVPPIKDLEESLQRSADMRLAWLSWRDVWSVMGHASLNGIERGLCEDLIVLLECKGLAGFGGFGAVEPVLIPNSGLFFGESEYFGFEFSQLPSSGAFYV